MIRIVKHFSYNQNFVTLLVVTLTKIGYNWILFTFFVLQGRRGKGKGKGKDKKGKLNKFFLSILKIALK